MHNVTVVEGGSPWNKRRGQGNWVIPLLPFGCTVDFLPKPDTVKAMAKFEPRAQPGVLVGYRLQLGALWKGEYLVFPRERFVDYDFSHPRMLNELRPIRTLEVTLTDSEPQFMMKPVYDEARRTLNPRIIVKTGFIMNWGSESVSLTSRVRLGLSSWSMRG